MEHKLVTPEDLELEDISICSVCNGAEGTLTSECPGRPISSEEAHYIYNNRMDYKDGSWVIPNTDK